MDNPSGATVARLRRSRSEPPAVLRDALARIDVRIDGPRPWDPQVHDPRVYRRVLMGGELGAGESYMDGDWDCEALDVLVERLVRSGFLGTVGGAISGRIRELLGRLANLQSRALARRNVVRHYDLSDELYAAMLGPTRVYSCGYWRDATTLDDAQIAKLDLVCRKLGLERGMRVLDIGCGWGSFARHAAVSYGVEVVGVTLSPSQASFATTLCAGLPVEIRVQDYRDLHERFDRIASIGMFEHVGPKNHRRFFETAASCLADDGLFLLHSIGSLHSSHSIDAWMARYVFPNAAVPSVAQIGAAAEGLFVMEDWENFGAYYDLTLKAWHANFERAWPELRRSFDERFRRMWRYYLLSCAGAFRARHDQLWQIVFSPKGVVGGWRRPA